MAGAAGAGACGAGAEVAGALLRAGLGESRGCRDAGQQSHRRGKQRVAQRRHRMVAFHAAASLPEASSRETAQQLDGRHVRKK